MTPKPEHRSPWRHRFTCPIHGRVSTERCLVCSAEYELEKTLLRRREMLQAKNNENTLTDESQRAMVGANIANLPNGGDYTSERSANLRTAQTSIAQAAEAVNVGVRSVTAAKKAPIDESGSVTSEARALGGDGTGGIGNLAQVAPTIVRDRAYKFQQK
jgi:hypothetical protein